MAEYSLWGRNKQTHPCSVEECVYGDRNTKRPWKFTLGLVGNVDIWCTYKHLVFETVLKHPIRGICVTRCEIYRRRGW